MTLSRPGFALERRPQPELISKIHEIFGAFPGNSKTL
jgi:hypothetical protein